ncbi:hypothetical protein Tco_1031234 [Tanacetum coccineum]|uniref:Retrovirus-related Pol polyprotein from transposon TNT 1-94-like beta-barrel domain-containing protein n=1 Tax=Tanacetum coccineum TaxID=301880 RepID=A0ABQ5GA48_9ASTR
MEPASAEVRLKVKLKPDELIKDSGCSRHMTVNKDLFSTYEAVNGGNVVFGSNIKSKIIGKDSCALDTHRSTVGASGCKHKCEGSGDVRDHTVCCVRDICAWVAENGWDEGGIWCIRGVFVVIFWVLRDMEYSEFFFGVSCLGVGVVGLRDE